MRDNLVDTLVGHGRLIQGGAVYAGGVNTFHLLTVFVKAQTIECFLSAHQSTGSMGSRAVPVGVTLADANQAAITHVDGDQQLLTGIGSYSTLAENHVVSVNVIVDSSKLFYCCQTHAHKYHIHQCELISEEKLWNVQELEPTCELEVTRNDDGTIVIKLDHNGLWVKYEFTED